MIIVGIDPSLCHTGIVALRRGPVERNRHTWEAVAAATLKTAPKHGTQPERVDLQLVAAESWLQDCAATIGPPDLVVIEELSGAVTGHTRAGTTNAAGSQYPSRVAQAIRTLVGLTLGWDRVAWVTPTQRLQAVGLKRGASKQQVKRTAGRRVTGLPAVYSEHVADAVAIALAGAPHA